MGQLEPCPREDLGKIGWVLIEALGDLAINWILDHRHVSVCHDRGEADRWILNVDRHILLSNIDRLPLPSPCRAILELILICKKHLEVTVVPLGGMGGPSAFKPAGDGVSTCSLAPGVSPAKALLVNRGTLRVSAEEAGVAVSMGFPNGMASGGQSDRLLVVHRHSSEGFAYGQSGLQRIWDALYALWIDVDEAHLDCPQRLL